MKPVCLMILDGWGVNPRREGNAIALADTPFFDALYRDYPWTTIKTSGEEVGLPEGQMGNSEVGHLTIGAGRIIYQELTRISKAVREGTLEKNPVLTDLLEGLKKGGGALHLIGLVSDGGVHSHIDHLKALIDIASRRLKNVYVHAILDGRDTPPKSGAGYMKDLVAYMGSRAAVATVSGRFYAMDRDRRWERVKKAYEAMVLGEGLRAPDPVSAITEAYERGETDEFVTPTIIEPAYRPLSEGDGALFFNFRADRARELTSALAIDSFDGFRRPGRPALFRFVTMTDYDRRFRLPVLFGPQEIKNILAEVLSRRGLRQFRVSETEKYAHVTFFFNGGIEKPFEGEDRLLIPSVKDVATYDKRPEMRALEIAGAAAERIRGGEYSFVLMNLANGDMVGHTGILEAAIRACEAVDSAVRTVAEATIEKGWSLLITADHGNAEQMVDYTTGQPHTAHTTNPVPFILVDDSLKNRKLKKGGGLKDVAPTVLKIMRIGRPEEMTGRPLF